MHDMWTYSDSPHNAMGPVVSKQQYDKVMGYIEVRSFKKNSKTKRFNALLRAALTNVLTSCEESEHLP
jgi:acyl-CoA reductase-like NAD-dependent aldehyde dehydrogenase